MKENVFALERKQLSLTQEQLAKKLNTSRSNVANWENGQNNPSIELLIKCSNIFNCDVLYLAGYQNERIKTNDDIPLPDSDYYIPKNKNVDELELLFAKHKNILTESDKNIIKTIIEERKKEIDKKLREDN